MWVLSSTTIDGPYSLLDPAILVTDSHFLAFRSCGPKGAPHSQVLCSAILHIPKSIATVLVLIPVVPGTIVNPIGVSDTEEGSPRHLSTILQTARSCFPDTVKLNRIIQEEDDEESTKGSVQEDEEESNHQHEIDEELERLRRISEQGFYQRVSESNPTHGPGELLSKESVIAQYKVSRGSFTSKAIECLEETHFIVYPLIPVEGKNWFMSSFSSPINRTQPGVRFPEVRIPTSRIAGENLEDTLCNADETLESWMTLCKSDLRIYSIDTERREGLNGAGKNPKEMLDDMRRRHASGAFVKIVPPIRDLSQLTELLESCFSLDSPPETIRVRRVVGTYPADQDIEQFYERK